MPQMSPMSWLYLMFYFIMLYLIIMMMIYNIMMIVNLYYKNLNFCKKFYYKYLW